MRIWTVQPDEVYERLLKDEVLYTEEDKSIWITESIREKENGASWTFKDSYDWLVAEMKERIGNPPDGVNYPWWGWHTYLGKHKKPDLRTIGLGKKDTYEWCIELEIPDNQVLISDHDEWHCVLNDFEVSHFEYEPDKEGEWTNYEKAYDRYQEFLMSLSYEERERRKRDSWKEIFYTQYDEDRDKGWTGRKYLQCTFWELRLDQVIKAQRFKCR